MSKNSNWLKITFVRVEYYASVICNAKIIMMYTKIPKQLNDRKKIKYYV